MQAQNRVHSPRSDKLGRRPSESKREIAASALIVGGVGSVVNQLESTMGTGKRLRRQIDWSCSIVRPFYLPLGKM
jgi:hypothetical protein